jgi:dTDP-glucose 4,6-dehydratase/UDP-glucose 4-epimerase
LPPIHFVSGIQTSLGELAELAISLGGGKVAAVETPARRFDVHRFQGDPSNAAALLGWRAETPLADGFARLVAAYRQLGVATEKPPIASARE